MDDSLKKSIIDYLENQRLMGDEFFIDEKIQFDDLQEESINLNQKVEPVKKKVIKPVTKTKSTDIKIKVLETDWKSAANLDELYSQIHECRQCSLGKTRTNFVFGEGNPNADIMVIGEAPGKDEDEQGRPFVGRAGKLLTKFIESINLKREDVFIANICKCRPPGNRAPLHDEVAACLPFLLKQIQIIKPEFILALGATAVASLTGTKPVMAEARGKITDFHGTKMLITYHPAALLYNPNLKRAVWEDVKLLRKLYDEYLEQKNES